MKVLVFHDDLFPVDLIEVDFYIQWQFSGFLFHPLFIYRYYSFLSSLKSGNISSENKQRNALKICGCYVVSMAVAGYASNIK